MVTRYDRRGVSSSKDEVHRAIAGMEKGLFPGAFCKIQKDIAGSPDYCTLIHSDGAGTKAGLAYLAINEESDSGFERDVVCAGIAQDSLVMNIDDAACVGFTDELAFVDQTINRNKFLVTGEDLAAIIAGCEQFCGRMNDMGFNLHFSGGETADVPDLVRTLTLDNSLFVRLSRKNIIDASRIVPGDVIVGFSSTGQARWEDKPNAGGGCNGYTNLRHELLSTSYRLAKETYAPEMPPDLVYRGKYLLSDRLPGDSDFTIGSALLSPTRTYLPLVRQILKTVPREDIHAFIHCSGGGQTKIGKFGDPRLVYIKDKPFPLPPLFKLFAKVSGMPRKEIYSSTNAGHRFEAVVPKRRAGSCIAAAEHCNIEAKEIGYVAERQAKAQNKVRIRIFDELGEYEF